MIVNILYSFLIFSFSCVASSLPISSLEEKGGSGQFLEQQSWNFQRKREFLSSDIPLSSDVNVTVNYLSTIFLNDSLYAVWSIIPHSSTVWKVKGNDKLLTSTVPGTQYKSKIISLVNSNVSVLCWVNNNAVGNYNLYCKRISSGIIAPSSITINPSIINYDFTYDIQPLNESRWIVTWVQVSNGQVLGKIYDEGMNPLTSNFEVFNGNSVIISQFPTIAVVNNSVYILHSIINGTIYSGYLSKLNYNGTVLDSIVINFPTVFYNLKIGVYNESRLFVNWYNNTQTYFLEFSSMLEEDGYLNISRSGENKASIFSNRVAETLYTVVTWEDGTGNVNFRLNDGDSFLLSARLNSTVLLPQVYWLNETTLIFCWIGSDDIGGYNVYSRYYQYRSLPLSSVSSSSFSSPSPSFSSSPSSSSLHSPSFSSSLTSSHPSPSSPSLSSLTSSHPSPSSPPSRNMGSSSDLLNILNIQYGVTYYFNFGTFSITGGTDYFSITTGGLVHLLLNENLNVEDGTTIDLFSFTGNVGAFDYLDIQAGECYYSNGVGYKIEANVENDGSSSTFQIIFNENTSCLTSGDSSRFHLF